MQIHLDQDGNKGAFYMEDKGARLAEMSFTMAGALLIIDHTDVSDQLRNQGAGRQLLDKLVAYARENNIKVFPLCPFARAQFQKDASIRDVLHG